MSLQPSEFAKIVLIITMAKEETLKEAWEKLPAWKKTWFKIVAIIVVLGLISSCVLIIKEQNAINDAEKEAKKVLEELNL